jgi:hypothetical protein
MFLSRLITRNQMQKKNQLQLLVVLTEIVDKQRSFAVIGPMAKVQPRFVGRLPEIGLVATSNLLNIWVLAQRATALFATRR